MSSILILLARRFGWKPILYASFADEQPCVPEAHVLDTLTYIWVTSIYAAPI